MAVTAVFFDVGETLLDEGRFWAELGRLAGVEPHVIWAGMGSVIERGGHHSQVFERLGLEHPGTDAVGWETEVWYPDAIPCVERLREQGYFVGLAGNVGVDPSDFFREAGVEVDFVASSETLGVEKPSPAFFAKLLEAAGRSPHEVAYVGDRVDNDVEPALAAGMIAVHVRRGPWGYLHEPPPEAIAIGSLDELPAALEA